MIDELDAFNATVTLALARVARLPFKADPHLASTVAGMASLDIRDVPHEDAALRSLGPRLTLFGIYERFWRQFRAESLAASLRIIVNGPEVAVAEDPGGRTLRVRYDPRLGRLAPLPERWAVQSDSSGYADDIVLFSEDGLPAADAAALAMFVGPGTTLTFLRPSARCDFWFGQCGVRHDFSALMEAVERRAEMAPVHETPAGSPVRATVLGAATLRA